MSAYSDAMYAITASATPVESSKSDYQVAMDRIEEENKPGIASDIKTKVAQGLVGGLQSAVGLGNLAVGGVDVLTPGDLRGTLHEYTGYDPQATGKALQEVHDEMGQKYLSPEQKEADQAVSEAEGLGGMLKAAVTNPRAILGMVAESAPQMAGGMGATWGLARAIRTKAYTNALKATGDKAAARLAADAAVKAEAPKLLSMSAGTEGMQATGQIADQAEQQGRQFKDYAIPAIGAGVLDAAISRGLGSKFGDVATNLATGTNPLKGAGGVLKQTAKGMATEGGQEFLQSGQEQASSNLALGKPVMEGVSEQAVLGGLTGAAMGGPMAAVANAKEQLIETIEKNKKPNAANPVSDAAITALRNNAETAVQEAPSVKGAAPTQATTEETPPEQIVTQEAPSVEVTAPTPTQATTEETPPNVPVEEPLPVEYYEPPPKTPIEVELDLANEALRTKTATPDQIELVNANRQFTQNHSADAQLRVALLTQKIIKERNDALENSETTPVYAGNGTLAGTGEAEQNTPVSSEGIPESRQESGNIQSQIEEVTNDQSQDTTTQEAEKTPEVLIPDTPVEKIDEEAATSPMNDLPEQTETQKETGDYQKGEVVLHGLPIEIENPKGSERSGTDKDGNEWSVEMNTPYGEIAGTEGKDGDPVDVFIGDNPESDKVFVVNQVDPETGEFDEHKVLVGFESKKDAKEGYGSNYPDDWKGGEDIVETTLPELKAELANGPLTEPLEETVGDAIPGSQPVGATPEPQALLREEQPREGFFNSPEEAQMHATDLFGVGIKNLQTRGVLNFTQGKESWPEELRTLRFKTAEAVFDGKGKIWLDLNQTPRDRIGPAILHEIGEHYNLERMLGTKPYAGLLNQIENRAKIEGSQAQRVWNEVSKLYPHLDPQQHRRQYISEVIAKLGEINPKAPWYRRMLTQIKVFLTKVGLSRGLASGWMTEKDIHGLLQTSLRSAMSDYGVPRASIPQTQTTPEIPTTLIESLPTTVRQSFQGQAATSDKVFSQLADYYHSPKVAEMLFNANGLERPPQASISAVDDPETAMAWGNFNPGEEKTAWQGMRKAFWSSADGLSRLRLSVLPMEQIAILSEKILPRAKDYVIHLRQRTATITSWLIETDNVLEPWADLKFVHRARLNNLIQTSSLHDLAAYKEWSGIERVLPARDSSDAVNANPASVTQEAVGIDPPHGWRAYTQAKLSTASRHALEKLFDTLPGKNFIDAHGAYFQHEENAKTYLAEINRLLAAQDAAYARLTNLPEAERAKFTRRIAALEENIERRKVYDDLKNKLRHIPPSAQDVYRKSNELHNAMFRERLLAVQQMVHEGIQNKNKAKELNARLRQQFESNHLAFYYAPFSRFGMHFLYGKDANGDVFFTKYESQREADKARQNLKDAGGTVIASGQSLKDLNNLQHESLNPEYVRTINDLIANAEGMTKEMSDLLQDGVYQLYLDKLPEVSVRHNMQHRKGTPGFELDAMKAFASVAHHSASQLANLTEGRRMFEVAQKLRAAVELRQAPYKVAQEQKRIEARNAFIHEFDTFMSPQGKTEIKDALTQATEKAKTDDTAYNDVAYFAELNRLANRYSDLIEAKNEIDVLNTRWSEIIDWGKNLTPDNVSKAADVVREYHLNYNRIMTSGGTTADRISNVFSSLGFSYMMAFSLSSGIVNLAQTPVVAFPLMGGQFGFHESGVKMGVAYKNMLAAMANGKRDEDGNVSISTLYDNGANSTEYDRRKQGLFDVVKKNGLLSRTQIYEVQEAAKRGESYGTFGHHMSYWAGRLFHLTERSNREVTVDAAYDLMFDKAYAKEIANGALPEAARIVAHEAGIDYAIEVTKLAHGEYDPANTSRLFSGPVMRVAMQFKKYTEQMLFVYALQIRNIYQNRSSEIAKIADPAERLAAQLEAKQAAKNLMGLMFMQFSVAGFLGMPVMGALGVAINLVGNAVKDEDDPEYDYRRDMYHWLYELMGERMSRAFMSGAFNALTPYNIGGRLGIDTVLFREPLVSDAGDNPMTQYLANLSGPFGSVLQDLTKSIHIWAYEDEPLRAIETAMPKAVKDIFKAFRYGMDDARSMNGDLLKEMTIPEVVGQAFGFSSSDMEAFYKERAAYMDVKNSLSHLRQKLVNKIARARIQGDEEPNEERSEWNKKYPTLRIDNDTIRRSMKSIRTHGERRGILGYEVDKKYRDVYGATKIRDL